ncbi:MAG: FecR domain-containing protein, partial [Polyangiaceae bacterium]
EHVPIGNTHEVVPAAEGRARARLASGAEVDIAPESRVRLVRGTSASPAAAWTTDPGNESVVLGSGRVTLRVPKLGPSRSLAVQTPEATIIVHGTSFSVERSSSSGNVIPRTMVGVTEGTVAVRHDGTEILLQAGDRWSSGPSLLQEAEPAAAKVEPSSAAPDRVERLMKSNTAPRASNAGGRGTETREKGSSLAAENRLLQAAMAARQEGDARRAAQLAGELVTRFPTSPLVEEARVERMRALVGAGGSASAAAEARSYLSDYPQGFARQEANRILSGTPR